MHKIYLDIDKYKAIFKGKLRIKHGIEMGQIHYNKNFVKSIIAKNDFDYIISSIHKINDVDLKNIKYNDKNINNICNLYLNLLQDMVKDSDFDCVGHLDLIKRYAYEYNIKVDLFRNYKERIYDILKLIIARGKGIEINTSGLRQKVKQTFPCFEIIKLYKDIGGEIITVGSDAHSAEQLGYSFKETKDTLLKAGFSKIALFNKRKYIFYNIK